MIEIRRSNDDLCYKIIIYVPNKLTQMAAVVEVVQKSVEDYLSPHLSTLSQLYHREALRGHTYSSETCTASVVQNEGSGDIGGILNNVYKVDIVMDCFGVKQTFSVVVKHAPTQVQVRCCIEVYKWLLFGVCHIMYYAHRHLFL